MKKVISIVAMMLTCVQVAWSYGFDFEYDNFAYNINEDGTLTMVPNDYSKTVSGHVVIPDQVLYKGRYYKVAVLDDTFYDNADITSVTIGKNVKIIGDHTFYSCTGLAGMLTIPEGVTRIGNSAFSHCGALTGVKIPKSLTSIGDYAFYECEALTAVYITNIAAWCQLSFHQYWDSPLSYAHHLYLNGTEVQNLEIPDEATSIGDFAFYECTSLQSMNTGNGVDTIGWRSFLDCTNLRSVTFGKNVKYIKDDAFYGCSALSEIFSYPVNPPTLEGNGVFDNVDIYSITAHVPKGSKDKYNMYFPWYWFNIVEDLVTTTPGDCNGDGEVDVKDVTALITYILGTTPPNFNVDNANVNGEGEIDVQDVTALINLILK